MADLDPQMPAVTEELELIIDGASRGLPSANFFIGTDASCAIRVRPGRSEPRHAQVWQGRSGQWWLRPVPPAQVMVGGAPTDRVKLEPGLVMALGTARVEVRRVADREAKTLVGSMAPVAPPTPLTLAKGVVISGRYRVVERIAGGGVGEVFRVEHLELGKTFALKVLRAEFTDDAEFLGRFKREAFAASRLGHEHIVEVTDSGTTDAGQSYLVMEDLRGETLLSHLKRGRLELQRAAHVALQVASALEAAHGEGVIHRDLKPANIMLLQRPRRPDFVKVLDFGAAKVLTGTGALALTGVGMVIGTPEYMSPEHAGGQAVDARTDLYSLGVLLYEMLTGKRPFIGATPTALIVQQLSKQPPPFAPSFAVPPTLGALVFELLAKKPGERPPSAGAVIERLEPFTR
ncbi:MAG: serine/threonine protein kinase [Myxococcaceae bacterium]|nr:serine/threonine protein kinase [Myxococcaceae bacterium]